MKTHQENNSLALPGRYMLLSVQNSCDKRAERVPHGSSCTIAATQSQRSEEEGKRQRAPSCLHHHRSVICAGSVLGTKAADIALQSAIRS